MSKSTLILIWIVSFILLVTSIIIKDNSFPYLLLCVYYISTVINDLLINKRIDKLSLYVRELNSKLHLQDVKILNLKSQIYETYDEDLLTDTEEG